MLLSIRINRKHVSQRTTLLGHSAPARKNKSSSQTRWARGPRSARRPERYPRCTPPSCTNGNRRHAQSASVAMAQPASCRAVGLANEVFANDNPIAKQTSLLLPSTSATPVRSKNDSYEVLWLNRLIICTIFIVMLWMTSLSISTLIVSNVVVTPPLSAVYDVCHYTWDLTHRMKKDYEQCIDHQSQTRFSLLEAANAAEMMRAQAVATENKELATAYEKLTRNLSATIDAQRTVLSQWLTGGSAYSLAFYPACSRSQRQAVQTDLGASSDSNKAVLSKTSLFTSTTLQRVSRMSAYTQDLTSYNYHYVANKTASLDVQISNISLMLNRASFILAPLDTLRNSLDVAMSCLTLDSNVTCPYSTNLRVAYDEMRQNQAKGIASTEAAVRIMREQAQYYEQTVLTALRNADNFYESIAGTRGLVVWLVKVAQVFGSSNALCGRSSPDWCTFSKMDWAVPPLMMQSPRYPVLPNADEFWTQMYGVPRAVEDNIAQATEQLVKSVEDWTSAVVAEVDRVDVTLKDYHPPQYDGNLTQEDAAQEVEAQAFLADLQNSLYSPNATTLQIVKASAAPAINTTAVRSREGLQSLFHSQWARFQLGTVDFMVLLSSFASVQGVLYIFDYIYRALHTVKLVGTFWGRGVVRLPRIDRRRKQAMDVVGPCFSRMNLALRVLPLVWVQLLMLLACIVLLAWLATVVLVPEYRSYVDVCVLHRSNRTMLSANMYAFAFNFAKGAGESDLAAQVSKYNSHSADLCSSQGTNARQDYLATLQSLSNTNQSLIQTRTQWQQLTQCVDVESMICAIASSCTLPSIANCSASASAPSWQQCPVSLLAYSQETWRAVVSATPSATLQSLVLHSGTRDGTLVMSTEALGSTESVFYDCGSLPLLQTTCAGPNPLLLEASTLACSCMAEWLWNSYLVQTTLSLVVYVVLNVSRVLVCKGLTRIVWRRLSAPVFECVSDCDGDGMTIRWIPQGGAEDLEDGRSPEKLFADLIAQRVAQYERQGYVMLLLGMLVNALWIALLFQVDGRIQYRP